MTSLIDARPTPAGQSRRGNLVLSDGTELSWDEVVEEFRPALTAFARSRGIREPEDLVQDVFVAALERRGDFEGDLAGLRSLLFTIAFRRIADEHRRWYRRRETLVPEHTPLPDPGPTVEEAVGRREATREAMEALVVLSERERRVLHMRIFEDATPRDVGKSLGLSSGNVRVIQARALVKIREYLRTLSGEAFPTIAIGGVPFEFVRYLRTELPSRDVVGEWLTEMRSVATAPLPEAATGAGGAHLATLAEGSASSMMSMLAGPGMARLGVLVSVVSLSAGTAIPYIAGDAGPAPLAEAAISELGSEDPVLAHLPVGSADPGPVETGDGIADDPVIVTTDEPTPATTASDNPGPTPDIPGHEPGSDDPDVADPPAVADDPKGTSNHDDTQDQPADEDSLLEGTMAAVGGNVVQPLVDGVVGPLLDDVVAPLAEDVVQPLVEDTVEAVNAAVQPVVDEVVDPLLDEVVDPLLEDDGVVEAVEDAVEETGSFLKSFLGLP